MTGFKIEWNRYYPDCPPLGYRLRAAGAQHWLRIHSLPGSKRYAETDDERGILLARQNELATEVLGFGRPCWLAQTCWVTPEGMIDIADADDPFWACREYDLSFSWSFLENDDEEHAWKIYATLTQWEHGKFDRLLLSVAEEKAAPSLWMSELGAVFAPYDGGVDLFLPTLLAVEKLRMEHPAWLSAHPQGL